VSRRLALLLALAGCAGSADETVEARYLHDPAFRRAELDASLVNPANDYSRVRLERYGRAWDALPAWNPRIARMDTPEPRTALVISDAARAGDRDALLALGRAAFDRYPAQLFDLTFTPTANDGYGLRAVVEAEMADGSVRFAYTCATCHTARGADGALVPGLANAAPRHGPLARRRGPRSRSRAARVGPRPRRRLDARRRRSPCASPISADPLPDHLQVNATVEQRDLASLAIRIETLIIVGHGQVIRPPREIAAGLALYIWSLAPAPTIGGTRGRDLFADHCARCHVPPAFSGAPVDLDSIGATDPVGRSASRGTGTWRVPSLVGVASRTLLFHDGSLSIADDVLDPARLAPSYGGGRRPGPVTEHRFGLELDTAARADLVAYLHSL